MNNNKDIADIFHLGALTPGEIVPMRGYKSVEQAVDAAKLHNLSSYAISKAIGFDGDYTYNGWQEVCRFPEGHPNPTDEQYENWSSYPVQECEYTK